MRFHKLSFPTFGGKEDPKGWLYSATNSSRRNALARRTRFGSPRFISLVLPKIGTL